MHELIDGYDIGRDCNLTEPTTYYLSVIEPRSASISVLSSVRDINVDNNQEKVVVGDGLNPMTLLSLFASLAILCQDFL